MEPDGLGGARGRKGYHAGPGSAAAMAEPTGSAPRLRPPVRLARQVSFWGFAALLVAGVAFYLWWGLTFGGWLDNGVYAVTIVLVLFGLSGMWLMLPNPPAPAPAAGKP